MRGAAEAHKESRGHMTHGEAPSVSIRLATRHDADAIERFYRANEHPFVGFRPERLASLLSEQALLAAETGGLIVGAAGILHHDAAGGRQCVELIQGQVILESMGLYWLLIACRLLLIESKYPGSTLVFCEIDEINTRARSIYNSLGFVEFAPDSELERMSIETLPIRKRPQALGYGFAWYKADVAVMKHVIDKFCSKVIHENDQVPEGRIRAQYCDHIHAMIARRACIGHPEGGNS
jgi:hypothetical protein